LQASTYTAESKRDIYNTQSMKKGHIQEYHIPSINQSRETQNAPVVKDEMIAEWLYVTINTSNFPPPQETRTP
jgi:hypothetical protein